MLLNVIINGISLEIRQVARALEAEILCREELNETDKLQKHPLKFFKIFLVLGQLSASLPLQAAALKQRKNRI